MQAIDETHPVFLKLAQLLHNLKNSVQTKYLGLLKPVALRLDQSHLSLNSQFLRRFKEFVNKNQDSTNTEQEEQKEASLNEEFLHFQSRVVKLENELKELKNNWSGDQGASLISQKISDANQEIAQWADQYPSLITASERVLQKFEKEITHSYQEESKQVNIQNQLEKMEDTPVKKQIASDFASLRQKAQLVRLTYNHEAKFEEMKRALISAVEALTFEEFTAYLPQNQIGIIARAKQIEEECEERLLKLAESSKEVNPSQHRPIYSKIESLDTKITQLTEEVKTQGTSPIVTITDQTTLKAKIIELSSSLVTEMDVNQEEKEQRVHQGQEQKEEMQQIEQEEYIFFPIRGTSSLSSISLLTKFKRDFEYGFTFPLNGMSCTHIPDSLICAGGEEAATYLDRVLRLPKNGSVIDLPSLPVAKGWFPMTYRNTTQSVITVGGNNGQELSEVNSLSLSRQLWTSLPDMSQPMSDRAACIVSPDCLCVFGGNPFNSGRGIELLNMIQLPLHWITADIGNTCFEKRYNDHAAVIGDGALIVIFGSKKGKTFWQIEADPNNKPLTLKHTGKLTIPNFSGRSTYKVFQENLYVFSDQESFGLFKYSLDERKWINC